MAAADALDAWLAHHFGSSPRGRTPVAGGCIHQALRVPLEDGRCLFVKANRAHVLPQLEAEADGLAALAVSADPDRLVVPAPLAWGVAGQRAVLVLPWLELDGGAAGRGAPGGGWRAAGAALADLHRRSLAVSVTEGDRRDAFGWPRDNFIGAGPQANGWLERWNRFFTRRRLAPQLELLERNNQPMHRAGELLERVEESLAPHRPEPCLVHGDLWSGNASLMVDGRAALVDPAVHRADREVDLAMARLFGGFPEAFFTGYRETWPLPPGDRERVALYNLYHLLNHANLFGGSYRSRAQAVIDDLL